MDLVAWPRAQFQNNAASSLYERRNNGCVFVSNKPVSYVSWLVYSVHELNGRI